MLELPMKKQKSRKVLRKIQMMGSARMDMSVNGTLMDMKVLLPSVILMEHFIPGELPAMR